MLGTHCLLLGLACLFAVRLLNCRRERDISGAQRDATRALLNLCRDADRDPADWWKGK